MDDIALRQAEIPLAGHDASCIFTRGCGVELDLERDPASMTKASQLDGWIIRAP
jgi:hypothetical protein